jgi:hypothetical protein
VVELAGGKFKKGVDLGRGWHRLSLGESNYHVSYMIYVITLKNFVK